MVILDLCESCHCPTADHYPGENITSLWCGKCGSSMCDKPLPSAPRAVPDVKEPLFGQVATAFDQFASWAFKEFLGRIW